MILAHDRLEYSLGKFEISICVYKSSVNIISKGGGSIN